ncbi:hypothetical protein BamIOP4010DRAFT_0914 [Burkholderia ambifaria IOP40-10]|uniref:Uncharacterized protein n=1 Tax=Burkholderia ambifaria IOP40-10 TaxID=396596 RepID=B1FA55_9BURK|nr:hypothetical protein BamIOP4010DRAFT_0914 [Burkholderia ambifaria IOP40-10]
MARSLAMLLTTKTNKGMPFSRFSNFPYFEMPS